MGDKKEKKVLVYNSEAPIEEQVVSLLKGLKKTITTAESITGGMISAAITSVEGASECFKVGYVSYSNKAKRKLLFKIFTVWRKGQELHSLFDGEFKRGTYDPHVLFNLLRLGK